MRPSGAVTKARTTPEITQLQVWSGLTFAMRNRASRDFRPDRTRHELVENLGWQLMQMRHRECGAHISIHGRTLQSRDHEERRQRPSRNGTGIP